SFLCVAFVTGTAYAGSSVNGPGKEAKPFSGLYVAERDIPIKANVKDENGQPLPDASIKIKGASGGTMTDVNGNFVLNVPSAATVLVVSYTGYNSREITVGNQTTINVQLAPIDESLNEVVVIGYGTARRSDLTGAV